MANICDNTFYAYSEDKDNITYIREFLEKELSANCDIVDEYSIDASFDSKWVFPEEIMDKLYDNIPNKNELYMRCLSVEYGCNYVSLHECEKDGWICIV